MDRKANPSKKRTVKENKGGVKVFIPDGHRWAADDECKRWNVNCCVYLGLLRLSEVCCETRDQLFSHCSFPTSEPAAHARAGSANPTEPCASVQYPGSATHRLVATSETAAGASAAAAPGPAHTPAGTATAEPARSTATASSTDFDGHDRKGRHEICVEGIQQQRVSARRPRKSQGVRRQAGKDLRQPGC